MNKFVTAKQLTDIAFLLHAASVEVKEVNAAQQQVTSEECRIIISDLIDEIREVLSE